MGEQIRTDCVLLARVGLNCMNLGARAAQRSKLSLETAYQRRVLQLVASRAGDIIDFDVKSVWTNRAYCL